MAEESTIQPLSIASEEYASVLRELPDEVLQKFSFPLFTNASSSRVQVDADGFPMSNLSQDNLWDFKKWQIECWNKAESNPQLSSHVRDVMGRKAGWGFEFNSRFNDIQRFIEEVVDDPRNDLYVNFPKYCAIEEIAGEVFFMFTLHSNGFVEVDFINPSSVGNGGDKGSGILFHPTKQTFPLFYLVNYETQDKNKGSTEEQVLVPSVNIAYFPELEEDAKKHKDFDVEKTKFAKYRRKKVPYNDLNGYFRFMVHWNNGFMTKRNVSHIRSTIEWVNYYEELKKYEIDHKRSSGAYLWVVSVDDFTSFRNWLNMSESDRKKTGIMQPKDPGGTLVLPPGMSLTVENPKLPNISDQDTDIMQMVSSGLQKPQDTMLGDYRSTYASVKAAQGPQGDRINDELHYFKLFLTYHFWRPILWLHSKAKPNFKYYRKVEETVDFKNQKPVKGNVTKPCYKFVEICLPTSRLEDMESTSKALLGTKHGSLVDVLGLPREEIAKRLGFSNYSTLRKMKATEDEHFPETISGVDQESEQEKREAEPPRKKKKEDEEEK